jgi:hypothetical protein
MIQWNEADVPEMLTEAGNGLMATLYFLKGFLRHDMRTFLEKIL